MKVESRVTTVDFARGLMACAVMIYHLLYWESIADIERIGFYAVYGFFVISGFSLHIAYRDKLVDFSQLQVFAIRRYARIAPLFYTALALYLLQNGLPDRWPVLLAANFSLTLGFLNPGETSVLVGGWSIGVEIVFYVLFPIVLLLVARSKGRLFAIATVTLVVQLIFVNYVLAGLNSTGEGWVRYTQPVSFAGYFVMGMFFAELYRARPYMKGAPVMPKLAFYCLIPFIVIPASEPLDLLQGWRGLILAASTIGLVGAAAFIEEPTGRLRQVAKRLGDLSYSIYLLHPLAFVFIRDHGVPTSSLRIIATLVLTIVAAHLTHKYIEVPARELGPLCTYG